MDHFPSRRMAVWGSERVEVISRSPGEVARSLSRMFGKQPAGKSKLNFRSTHFACCMILGFDVIKDTQIPQKKLRDSSFLFPPTVRILLNSCEINHAVNHCGS